MKIERIMDEIDASGKKQKVIIVGHIGTPAVGSKLYAQIEKMKESGELIVVDSVDELTEKDVDAKTLAQLKKQDPFGPEPFKITKLAEMPLPKVEYFNEQSQSNPWPSPKGRNGKKRY